MFHFLDEFNVKENNGLYLITPENIMVRWRKDNLIFRSSIWDSNDNPVSLSFKKFFNWGEHPHLYEYPKSLSECSIMEKMDGSTLIVSKYKKQMIFRTRGSFDLLGKDNSFEVLDFIQDENHHKIFDLENGDTWENSYIFEWYSPVRRIVLNYGDKPIFWLTCIIKHKDYSYWKQDDIDNLAKEFNFLRPKRYKFSSLEELNKEINEIPNLEGVCVYYNNDQNILKLKSKTYLIQHAFKSECNFKTIVNLWFDFDKPDYDNFTNLLSEKFDYECCKYASSFVLDFFDIYKIAKEILEQITTFADTNKQLSRKEFAIKIIDSYGKGSVESFIAFALLGNNEISDDTIKKLIFSVKDRQSLKS